MPSAATCDDCLGAHAPGAPCPARAPDDGGAPVEELEPLPDVDGMLGRQLGSFRLVRRLGQGGMGSVYLGEHLSIGSRVAVKVLHAHLAAYPSLVQRFHAEARAVNVIGHENIVSIFDLQAPQDGLTPPYLIMEYLEGEPLAARMGGPMAPSDAVPILVQVCEALNAAHAQGIVHRDLKPENVFLLKKARGAPGGAPFVKVLDFGIAKLLDVPVGADVARTSAGLVVGTPEYMSPEQASGGAVDGRADQYALGVLAFQMLTGRLPFAMTAVPALLVAHQTQAPPDPRALAPRVGPALAGVVLRALEKAPAARFPDTASLGRALLAALEEDARPAPAAPLPQAPAQPAPPAPPVAKGPPAASVTAAVAAVLAERAVAPPVRAPAPAAPAPAAAGGVSGARTALLLPARVTLRPGAAPLKLMCSDLSRGGLFLEHEGPLPALQARVHLVLEAPGAELALTGEVVRHVSPEQGRAWGMPAGFGLQFVDAGPELRAALAALVAGKPLGPGAVTHPPVAEELDAEGRALLDQYRARGGGDPYALLGLTPDAPQDQVRTRGREARAQLEALLARRLAPGPRAQAEAALARVRDAADTLTLPERRAAHDAARGNWKGVARAIAGGLTVTQLEALRRDFLATRPSVAGQAHVQLLSGGAFERDGQAARARECYERGLVLDPLNLELQQRHRALGRGG